MTGCTKAPAKTAAASTKPADTGHAMAGPDVQVYIPSSIVNDKPAAWDLTTPEKAVQSYLAWTNYAYRIANSDVATPTMAAEEEVRVNSYVQFNLQRKKLLDQNLLAITVGQAQKSGQTYVVPTKEQWEYQYRSVEKGNSVVEGPYKVSYDATYTVVQGPKGVGWVVNSLTATRSAGTLK